MKNFLAAPGIKFNFIDPDNSTVRETVPGNTYEPAVANLLLKCIRPRDVVIDIGALYGYFSCFCGKVSPTVQVYAFDPCQSYCDVIERNASINQLSNVHAVPLALSDTNSEWQFKEKTLIAGSRGSEKVKNGHVPDMAMHDQSSLDINVSKTQGRVSVVSWLIATVNHTVHQLFSPPRQMSVSSIRYDDWAKQHDIKAKVAKIDVHGAEIVVLRGMSDALKHDFEHLIIEVHRSDMLVEGDYKELVSMLIQSGFELHELVDFRSDAKWQIVPLSGKSLEDFIDPGKWSFKNKVEMRMIYATKGEQHAN